MMVISEQPGTGIIKSIKSAWQNLNELNENTVTFLVTS